MTVSTKEKREFMGMKSTKSFVSVFWRTDEKHRYHSGPIALVYSISKWDECVEV